MTPNVTPTVTGRQKLIRRLEWVVLAWIVAALVIHLTGCSVVTNVEHVCEVRDYTVHLDTTRALEADTTVYVGDHVLGTYSFAVDSVTSVVTGYEPYDPDTCILWEEM